MSKNEIQAMTEAATSGLTDAEGDYREGFLDAVAIIAAMLEDDK